MEQNTQQSDFQDYLDSSVSSQYMERPQQPNAFMAMSLVMGGLAFMSCSFIFIAMIAGGLSILFALLSKGNHPRMHFMSKTGIIASVVAMVFSIIITASAFYLVFNNDEYKELFNQTYESMYGITFDEAMERAYPSLQGGGSDATGN